KVGPSEAEVEADLSHLREAIGLIPEVLSKLPGQVRTEASPAEATLPRPSRATVGVEASGVALPTIFIEKGDSLNDLVSKLFSDPWGKSPRKLSEVREALQSYGLNYPNQSVAVALLRLAKSSRIRRFKSEGGEYVYTASTSLILPQSPQELSGGSELEKTVNV
ncbi:MAG: hypothetical protein HYU03_05625, partial [Thaumarchaeota archaeon]|nr:hypothetical protein [Nitrososphaerota archaeon]